MNNNACGSSICQQGESCRNGECWNDNACGSRTNICSYSQLCLDGTTCVEDNCVNRQAVGCPCSLGDNPIGKWSCSNYGGTYSYGCTVSANGCSCQAGDCRGQCGCSSVPPPPYPTPPPVSTPATPRCEITSKKCGNACTATATDECQNGECVDLFKRPTPCGSYINGCGSGYCRESEFCNNQECLSDNCKNRQSVECPCSLGAKPTGTWSCSIVGGVYKRECSRPLSDCSSSSSSSGASTLSTGALIGVIAGSMVGVALVCGIAAGAVLSRRKKHSAATDAPMFQ